MVITGMNLEFDFTLKGVKSTWNEAMTAVSHKNRDGGLKEVWRLPSRQEFLFIYTFKDLGVYNIWPLPSTLYWTNGEHIDFSRAIVWFSVHGDYFTSREKLTSHCGIIMVREI
jgi:hypothetical protein